jgi:1,4-alpha-glucan branching enzyme
MHMDWGTLIYNFGRREVANFLIANALYWCERFGIDGLRVDAVASMLYLNYSRKHGEWLPNRFGGVENEEAVAMLRRFNEQVFGGFPRATTIAEESTAWPMVSRPTNYGGLGFGFKWNMGWMHDTLAYVEKEAVHRRYHHHQMSFGLIYAFSENFVLPLSHDEVVYGKKSLLSKMPGDDWQRFANLRAYFGFMWTHPGKKLLFMGGEFGQWNEWNYEQSLDWHLLSYPHHQGIQALVRDLNQLYRGIGALHLKDCEPGGFEWIDANDSDQSVYSYLRRGRDEGDIAIVVCNFTPVVREGYRVGVPFGGAYVERLNTDSEHYGGGNVGNAGRVEAGEVGTHGRPWSLLITLPPLATLVFTPVS